MKCTNHQLHQIELPIAGLWVLGMALLSGDPVRMGLLTLAGGLWLVVAWKARLSLLLMSFLLFLVARNPMGQPLPYLWVLAIVAGLGTWVCSMWSRHLLSAAASSVMWGGMAVLAPPLWLLGLSGLPRLARLHAEHPRWAVWPGLLLTGVGVGLRIAQGTFTSMVNQLAEADTYLRIRDAAVELSQREQLWLILPIVGVFELAQRQTDDHRFNWRNVIMAGGMASLLLVPAEVVIPLVYAVALPLSAFMLTRWLLALPDWPSRVLVSAGLLAHAYPLMLGGSA